MENNKIENQKSIRSELDCVVIKPCPFRKVEKNCGHHPYSTGIDYWHVQCTCGARGPISSTEYYAINSWNIMDL